MSDTMIPFPIHITQDQTDRWKESLNGVLSASTQPQELSNFVKPVYSACRLLYLQEGRIGAHHCNKLRTGVMLHSTVGGGFSGCEFQKIP